VLEKVIMALAAWLAFGVGVPAGAVTHLDTSEVVAATPEAAAQLPPTYEFTLAAAGNYVLTLKDISVDSGLPQSLQSLQVLVTRDLQVVARLAIEYPSQNTVAPLPKTQTFAGTPGIYRVHVLGAIATNGAGGLFSVDVAPSAGGAAVFNVADAIATQSAPPSEQSVLQTEFTVSASGTYRVLALDRDFPAALTDRSVLVIRSSTQTPVVSSTGAFSTGDVGTFSAQAGETYELIVISTAGVGSAGLYGALVQNVATNAVIYRSENGVGRLPPARPLSIPTAATYSLALTDLHFPAALTAFSAAIIQSDTFVGSVTGATPGDVALSAGPAQLFVYSTAATTGTVSALLSSGGLVAYGDVHIIDASADATTPAIYSFSPSEPVAAANYTLSLDDLRFPNELPNLQALVVQQGQPLDRLNGSGSSAPIALAAGKVRVLVAATPPPASGTLAGNGAFALALKAANNAIVFESTQGVGGLFNAKVVNLPAAGRYDIELKDFEFPARLRISWLAVTHGTQLVGQVIGSSPIQNLQLEAGVHVLNFIGQPAANTSYGAFGVKVSDSTPAPVVTLSASPTSVTAGQASTLTWSATNATSCTATNGWGGTKTASGTQSTGALSTSSNTTFALECVGPGGRGSASVTVTVTAPTSGSSGGGGGHLDPLLLVSLASLLTLASARRQRRVMK
jgi:hypothetical protein